MARNKVVSCTGGTGMSYCSNKLILKGLKNKEKVIVLDPKTELMRNEDNYMNNKKINESGVFIGKSVSIEKVVLEKYKKADSNRPNNLILGELGEGRVIKVIPSNLNKLQIANELLNNTSNVYLKGFIKEYIDNINDIKNTDFYIKERADLIRLDNCIGYIEKVEFDITDWKLSEIPVFYSHCFFNKKTNQAFDLAVWDIGEVIPRYLKNCNENDASSINEAIEKYDNGSLN